MATRTLTGSDWNVAGNWNPAGVPVGGDEALMGPDSPVLSTGPTGANQNVKLDLIATHPLYKYAVCSSGTPMEIAAAKILIQHAGDFFFACDTGGVANKTDRVIVRCAAVNKSQQIQLGAAAAAGEIDFIEILRGNVRLTNATGINELLIDHVSNPDGDAIVTIDSGVATIPLVIALNGKVVCSTTVTSLHTKASRWQQILNTITNLYAGGRGVTEFNTNATCALARVGDEHHLDLVQDFLVKTFSDLRLTGRSRLSKFDDANLHALTLQDWRDAA